MGWMFDNVGRLIVRLQKPADNCEPFTPNDSMALRDTLRPGDVLLVEGKGRISGSIKYLTQSTWSHSALYVGPMAGAATDTEPHVLIEANIDEGVVSAPLSKYLHCQTRICRPVGLSDADCEKVCRYHILGVGVSDRMWSCVALCPNCHREAHFAHDRDAINAALGSFARRFGPDS
jgi:Permuted papain-like amidase enzyme, YaeF/YiiX, C92 family